MVNKRQANKEEITLKNNPSSMVNFENYCSFLAKVRRTLGVVENNRIIKN